MRSLVVAPYPPLRDGVGTYALQDVLALKESGHDVEVLSPMPTAAHHHLNLKGGLRLAKLRAFSRAYDQVILHYQPSHYHLKGGGISRLLSDLGMLITFASMKRLKIVCHEVEYPPETASRWHPLVFLEGKAWSKVRGEVIFHSDRERQLMNQRFRGGPKRSSIRSHDLNFTPFFSGSREDARSLLDIPASEKLLLCIGFIQPHKGFDRAMRAFSSVEKQGATLAVVGSVRTNDIADRNYVRFLRDLASADQRIDLRVQSLSDQEFDQWIIASDLVILPYRSVWSSGVMARARILDRPVIATNVGGIPDQATPSDTVVRDDQELTLAIAASLNVPTSPDSGLPSIDYLEAVRLLERSASSRKALDQEGLASLPELRDTEAIIQSLLKGHEVIPSTRPVLGPFVTIVKKVLNRVISRLFEARIEAMRLGTLSLLERIDRLEAQNLKSQQPGSLTQEHLKPQS